MNIELTNEQFRELLIDVAIGVYIRESACGEECEKEGEHACGNVREIEDLLLTFADKFGASDMVEKIEDELALSEEAETIVEDIIEDYSDSDFWERLIILMGQRDFLKTVTEDELKQIEASSGNLPDRIQDYCEKYAEEFADHGISRLQVVEE